MVQKSSVKKDALLPWSQRGAGRWTRPGLYAFSSVASSAASVTCRGEERGELRQGKGETDESRSRWSKVNTKSASSSGKITGDERTNQTSAFGFSLMAPTSAFSDFCFHRQELDEKIDTALMSAR